MLNNEQKFLFKVLDSLNYTMIDKYETDGEDSDIKKLSQSRKISPLGCFFENDSDTEKKVFLYSERFLEYTISR